MNDSGSLVIPIPLRHRHYLLRQHNQSPELARWLAPPETFAPNILQRRHHNKSQAVLSRAQRKKNVAGKPVWRVFFSHLDKCMQG